TDAQVVLLSVDVTLLALFHFSGVYRRTSAIAVGGLAWIFFAVTLSIPDSLFDDWGRRIWPVGAPFSSSESIRTAFILTSFFLENGRDGASGKPVMVFSRNLIITDDRYGNKRATDEAQSGDPSPTRQSVLPRPIAAKLNLRGRNLRYAILDRSDLRGADFTLADLTGASMIEADLRGARFGCATSEEWRPFNKKT